MATYHVQHRFGFVGAYDGGDKIVTDCRDAVIFSREGAERLAAELNATLSESDRKACPVMLTATGKVRRLRTSARPASPSTTPLLQKLAAAHAKKCDGIWRAERTRERDQTGRMTHFDVAACLMCGAASYANDGEDVRALVAVLNTPRALRKAVAAIESEQEGATADAGFDAGEFSGPAHGRSALRRLRPAEAFGWAMAEFERFNHGRTAGRSARKPALDAAF